jgi:prevent-host-death family protein
MNKAIFKIPKSVNAKKVRYQLGEIINKVSYGHQPMVITRNGNPEVVLIGAEDYEDMIDLMDTMAEELSPKFRKALKKARQEYERGEVGTAEDIKKILHT